MFLISDQPMKMFERECYAYIPLCHGKKILVPEGYKPALGKLIMIADNTGFSTGIHTHMGLYRVGYGGARVTNYFDTNEATGSFDPSLFFTNTYAVDEAKLGTLIKSNLRYYGYRMGLI
jgi:murein DD-endopeptidase MepM/ murein hydrolase activator NlpD